MAIYNPTTLAHGDALYVDWGNQIRDNTINSTDNIHPQYLSPVCSAFWGTCLHINTYTGANFYVHNAYLMQAYTTNIDNPWYTKLGDNNNSVALLAVSFVKGICSEIDIECLAIFARSNALNEKTIKSVVYHYDSATGTATLFDTGADIEPTTAWAKHSLSSGLDISAIPDDDLITVWLSVTTSVQPGLTNNVSVSAGNLIITRR